MEQLFLAGLTILSMVFLLKLIHISYKLHVTTTRVVNDIRWTHTVMCVALVAIILEIIVKNVGEIDQELSARFAGIIEKFPEKLVVSKDGQWCHAYLVLMDRFTTVCSDQRVIDHIAYGNEILKNAVQSRISIDRPDMADQYGNNVHVVSSYILLLSQFSSKEFFSQWIHLAIEKMPL